MGRGIERSPGRFAFHERFRQTNWLYRKSSLGRMHGIDVAVQAHKPERRQIRTSAIAPIKTSNRCRAPSQPHAEWMIMTNNQMREGAY
jgi:hypothetical protein